MLQVMLLQTTISSPPLQHHQPVSLSSSCSALPLGPLKLRPHKISLQHYGERYLTSSMVVHGLNVNRFPSFQIRQMKWALGSHTSHKLEKYLGNLLKIEDIIDWRRLGIWISAFSFGQISWLISADVARATKIVEPDAVYEVGELFELGIQLSYLLILLGFLGVGSFFVIRQVLVRRELDLSAKELQEQVRSGEANATGLFELGAVMLRRKFYPAATKYLLQAIQNWDGDDQDLAQVYNALGVSYVRDGKIDKGIAQFETAVKLQPGYVTAWNNLGDAYEKKKDFKSAMKAFEEVLLFDPNNKVARPRRDALKEKAQFYKGVAVKSKDR